jgi:predicted alpha/beta-fold hydrolase
MRLFIYKLCVLCLAFLASELTLAKNIKLKIAGAHYNAQFYSTGNQSKPTLIIVHDALTHNKSEFVGNISSMLFELDFNILAINLSLRLDNRPSNNYQCTHAHHHKFEDASGEISLWVKWLQTKQKVSKIWVLGYGLGANQIAFYLSRQQHPLIKGAILISAINQDILIKNYPYNNKLNRYISLAHQKEHRYIFPRINFFNCKQARVSAASLLSYYQEAPHFNISYLANKIKVPLLVIGAEQDIHHRDLKQKINIFHPGNKQIKFVLIPAAPANFANLYIMSLLHPITQFIR